MSTIILSCNSFLISSVYLLKAFSGTRYRPQSMSKLTRDGELLFFTCEQTAPFHFKALVMVFKRYQKQETLQLLLLLGTSVYRS